MFRRLFWFVAGAVAGITGVSWVKRRAGEMRDALTLRSVLGTVKDLMVATWQRAVLVLARNGFFIGGSGQEADSIRSVTTTTEASARRHIASRPHRSHR